MSKLDDLKKKVSKKREKIIKSGESTTLGVLGETGISRAHQRILTGNLVMDYLLGGFKPGTLIEFSGEENAGKTTLLWSIAQNLQWIYNSPSLFFNDVEGTSNDEQFLNRFPLLKVDDIIYSNTPQIEEFFGEVEEFADHLDIVLLDSIAAMSSVNRRALDKSDMGKTANVWSQGWKRLYDFSKKGIVFLAINQVRDNLDPYSSNKNGTQTTGGRALRHAKSAQIHVKKEGKGKAIKEKGFSGTEEIKAWETTIEVQKNKQGAAFKSITTMLWTDPEKPETFCPVQDAVAFGLNYGVIQRNSARGSIFTINNAFNGEEIAKVNGQANLEQHLRENPEVLGALKVFIYRFMLNDEFFYCLWDKVLLIARAEILMTQKKYGKELSNPKEVMKKLKKDFPVEFFFQEDVFKELQEKYGKPWTWGNINPSLMEMEEIQNAK